MKHAYFSELSWLNILASRYSTIVYTATLSFVTIILWYPTITIPYWWDSALFIIPATHRLLNTNFWPLVLAYTDFAHPPLFPLLLALVWKLFGESLLASHIVNLLFTLIAVVYIFRLGRVLIKDSPRLGDFLGFLSALLFLWTPPVLAQVGIIYLEIPVTAFALMSFYYFLTGKKIRFLLATIAMVLTKEVAVVIVVLYIVSSAITLWKHRNQTKEKSHALSFLLLSLIPLGILTLWIFYHYLVTGWSIIKPGRVFAALPYGRLAYILFIFHYILVDQMRWPLLIAYITLAVLLLARIRLWTQYVSWWDEKRVLLIVIPLLFPVLFGLTEFLFRYAVLVFPFLYLAFFVHCVIFFRLIKVNSRLIYGVIGGSALIMLFLFSSVWDEHRVTNAPYYTPLEDNLEYLNIVELGKLTAAYIQAHYPHARVYTGFPTLDMYSQLGLHYVSKPLQVFSCTTYKKGDRVDVVVYHMYSKEENDCAQIIVGNNWKQDHNISFARNGKTMTIVTP